MLSIAAFDLETHGLFADSGVLLVGVVQVVGERRPRVFRADHLSRRWDSCRSDDSAVVAAVAGELQRHDILVVHNGAPGGWKAFDVPFLQARMLRWGLGTFAPKKIIDPVQIARRQLRLRGNSLDAISAHLGLEPKMHLPFEVWQRAALDGCRKSMNTLVERCKSDVSILCDVARAVKGYCRQLDHRGSAW